MTRLAVGLAVGFFVAAAVSVAPPAPHPLAAQEAAGSAPVFQLLHGEWMGQGTLMGRTAEFTMDWSHRGRFATLEFSNAFVDSAGAVTPALRSSAVYRTSPDHADAVWLDSRGVRIEIRWEARDSALVSHWTAPTEEGRTTYRVLPGGGIEVTDEVAGQDGLRVFATATYARAPG